MLSNLVRRARVSNKIHHRLQEWFARLSDSCLAAGFSTRGPVMRKGIDTVSWELTVNRPGRRSIKVHIISYRGRLTLRIRYIDGVTLLDYSPHGYNMEPSTVNDWRQIKRCVPIVDVQTILNRA